MQDASKTSATRNVLEFMGVLKPIGQSKQQKKTGDAEPSTSEGAPPPPPNLNMLSMPLNFDYMELLSREERVELGTYVAQVCGGGGGC